MCVLEIVDIAVIFGILGVISTVVIYTVNKVKPSKKQVQKAVDSGGQSVTEMYSVYNQQVKDILKVKDNQIRSLSQKLNLEQKKPEQEEESTASIDELKPILQQLGLPDTILELPQVQKFLGTNENIETAKQLLPFIAPVLKQKMKEFGIQSPAGQGDNQTAQNPPTSIKDLA